MNRRLGFNFEYEDLKKQIITLKNEVSDLLFQRDNYVLQIIPQVEMDFQIKIGALEYKVFEFQCKILRIRRKIELVQQALNHEKNPDLLKIESVLDHEQADYEQKLEKMQSEVLNAMDRNKSIEKLSCEDTKKMKKIYFKIVRQLHPDLNPKINEKERSLLLRAVSAFERGSIEDLEIIEVMIKEIEHLDPVEDQKLSDSAVAELTKERNRLTEIKNRLTESIQNIENSFPCNQIEFLSDPSQVEKRKFELKAMLDSYEVIYEKYEKHLEILLKGENI